VRAVVSAVGAGDRLAHTLEALARSLEAAGAASEIVVVLLEEETEAARLAGEHSTQVRRVPPGAPRTPGACRNLGAAGAAGEFLLFLDGDVELDRGFVRRALAHLAEHRRAAAFSGRLDERQWKGGRQVGLVRDLYRAGRGGESEVLALAWLCRRACFEAAGGFDPALPSEEDFELCLRLRQGGSTLWVSPELAGFHDCAPRPTLAELERRWRSGLFAGQGLALKKYWGRAGFAELLARQRLFLGALLFGAAGLVTLGAALAGRPAPFVVWAVLAAAAWLAMSLRKRSARLGALSLLTWSVQGVALLRSLVFGPWGEMVERPRGAVRLP
jgi:hypothetical protein